MVLAVRLQQFQYFKVTASVFLGYDDTVAGVLFLDTPATALWYQNKILAVTTKCWNCCSLTANTMAQCTVPFRIV